MTPSLSAKIFLSGHQMAAPPFHPLIGEPAGNPTSHSFVRKVHILSSCQALKSAESFSCALIISTALMYGAWFPRVRCAENNSEDLPTFYGGRSFCVK